MDYCFDGPEKQLIGGLSHLEGDFLVFKESDISLEKLLVRRVGIRPVEVAMDSCGSADTSIVAYGSQRSDDESEDGR
jgi:hypothetical protein